MDNHIYFTTKSTAHVFAYIHRYRVKYLSGRCLSPTHLRALAAWIGWPMPQLRTIRNHPLLAAHLATLYAVQLITIEADYWICTLETFSWLRSTPTEQIDQLANPFIASSIHEAIKILGLEDVLTIDYLTYTKQMLQRARKAEPTPSALAEWITPSDQERQTELWLALPDSLRPHLTFHLLQLGEWMPGQPLRMTPPSILQARDRGYGEGTIKSILRQATGEDLPAAQVAQLADWISRAGTYRIRSASLLETRQPEQLAQIFTQRRLAVHIGEQISPRHAIVKETLIAPLRRWLSRRGYHLEGVGTGKKGENLGLNQNAYTALSLRVLAQLSQFLSLPFSIPYHVMQTAEEELTAEERETVAQLRDQIMADLRQVLRGRDGFFPANTSPNPVWIDILQGAILEESSLHITYQSLGDYRPRYRHIQPLRLERRGDLHYLQAYCYQAESTLTFRLDRINSLWEDEEE